MTTVRKGMTPYKKSGEAVNTAGQSRALVSNGYATALAKGDPIYVSNGLIRVAANTSVNDFITVAASAINLGGALNRTYGVFEGCKYIDSNTGQPVESTLKAASVSSGGVVEGETQILGFYTPAKDTTFLMIAEASVSALQVGNICPVSVGTPSAIFKRSVARMKAAVASAGVDHMVRVVSFPNISGSAADDANTIVEVEIVLPYGK